MASKRSKRRLAKSRIKKKVLVLSVHDYAGSGHRYSEAVNRVGKYKSTSLKFLYHSFGYDSDYCIARDYNEKIDKKLFRTRLVEAQKLVDEADILHFKGDYPVSGRWGLFKGKHLRGGYPTLSIPLEKPIVLTASGSKFRRHLVGGGNLSLNLFPMETMVKHTNARTVTTPDLNYPEFDSEWLPFALDTKATKNIWLERSHDIIKIGHTPSNRRRKGTDSILVPAIKLVKEKGFNVELEIVEKKSYKEILEIKKGFSMFWDQCSFGFYGNSLVEAAQYGVPCMTWLSETSLKQSGPLGDFPIVTFDRNPESCADEIIKIITGDIETLSKRTKAWADRVHSYESVGAQLTSIYNRVLRG